MGYLHDKLKVKEGHKVLLMNSPLEAKLLFIDATWSALRFRAESKIQRKKDSVILKRK